MSGARMGHCEYCNKEHDLRVACPEYVKRIKEPIKKSEPKSWFRKIVNAIFN